VYDANIWLVPGKDGRIPLSLPDCAYHYEAENQRSKSRQYDNYHPGYKIVIVAVDGLPRPPLTPHDDDDDTIHRTYSERFRSMIYPIFPLIITI